MDFHAKLIFNKIELIFLSKIQLLRAIGNNILIGTILLML